MANGNIRRALMSPVHAVASGTVYTLRAMRVLPRRHNPNNHDRGGGRRRTKRRGGATNNNKGGANNNHAVEEGGDEAGAVPFQPYSKNNHPGPDDSHFLLADDITNTGNHQESSSSSTLVSTSSPQHNRTVFQNIILDPLLQLLFHNQQHNNINNNNRGGIIIWRSLSMCYNPMLFSFILGCCFGSAHPDVAYRVAIWYAICTVFCVVLFSAMGYTTNETEQFVGSMTDTKNGVFCAEMDASNISTAQSDFSLHNNNNNNNRGSMDDPSLLGPPAAAVEQTSAVTKLLVHNLDTKEPIGLNTLHQPFTFENEYYKGQFLLLVKPPDDDDIDQDAVNFFRGKQRRFEFQFQGRIKKIPDGPVYMAMELENAPKFGMIQRTMVAGALAFVKKMNRGFHYSLAQYNKSSDGQYEVPHLAFPVDSCIDRLVISKPTHGDAIPKLGVPILEDASSIKARKKGTFQINWNLEDTYTMSVYSAYVDWTQWKILGLPGIRPFGITSVTGAQPIAMQFYSLASSASPASLEQAAEGNEQQQQAAADQQDKHWVCHKRVFSRLELAHEVKTVGGVAQEMLLKRQQQQQQATSAGDQQEEDPTMMAAALEAAQGSTNTEEDLNSGLYLQSEEEIILEEYNVTLPLLATNNTTTTTTAATKEYVSNGGSFAVMQTQSTAKFALEKVHSKCSSMVTSNSTILYTGDTVLVKLLSSTDSTESSNTEVRYLSTHRGWWLKWVKERPRNNGFFLVTQCNNSNNNNDNNMSSAAALSVGTPFCLRHRRWPLYEIGVGQDYSANFGGRLLGLRLADATRNNAGSDPSSAAAAMDQHPSIMSSSSSGDGGVSSSSTNKSGQWLDPFQFCAHYTTTNLATVASASSITEEHHHPPYPALRLMKDASMCVPAWVEVMDRASRKQQRTYAVRITTSDAAATTTTDYDDASSTKSHQAFVRLRTGRELVPMLEIGRSLAATSESSSLRAAHISVASGEDDDGSDSSCCCVEEDSEDSLMDDMNNIVEYDDAALQHMDGVGVIAASAASSDGVNDDRIPIQQQQQQQRRRSATVGSADLVLPQLHDHDNHHDDNDEEVAEILGYTSDGGPHVVAVPSKQQQRLRRRNTSSRILRTARGVAKTVTYGTAGAGKVVVRQSFNVTKKVGKGTLVATKKVGKVVAKNVSRSGGRRRTRTNPGKEPKVRRKGKGIHKGVVRGVSVGKLRQGRDHHVLVNRIMKPKRRRSHNIDASAPTGVQAAPDQSVRVVNSVLSNISSSLTNTTCALDENDAYEHKHPLVQISATVYNLLNSKSNLDTWFLQGGATELGVTPSNRGLKHSAIVARGMWESHWREEWAGVYETHVSFYVPLSSKPSLVIPFSEIIGVRSLKFHDQHSEQLDPFPGLGGILAIDCMWRSHYLVFVSVETKEKFKVQIAAALMTSSTGSTDLPSNPSLLFQENQWAPINSSSKSKKRAILNARLMSFDCSLNVNCADEQEEGDAEHSDIGENEGTLGSKICQVVEDTLCLGLSLSTDSLEKAPDKLIAFLNATSAFRLLPLRSLDVRTDEAVCIFLNLYHCLVQHALLVEGAPNKRYLPHHMRRYCYEIDGDVFSIAEIECIIRNSMSSVASSKNSPFGILPSKHLQQRYRSAYGLFINDARLNFALNNGMVPNPSSIIIFNPSRLDHQLNIASKLFLRHQLAIEGDSKSKRTIILPKVTEVYRNDFDGRSLNDATQIPPSHKYLASIISFCCAFANDDESVREQLAEYLKQCGSHSNDMTAKFQHVTWDFHSSLTAYSDSGGNELDSLVEI